MKQAGSAIYSQGQASSSGGSSYQDTQKQDGSKPYERVVDADFHE